MKPDSHIPTPGPQTRASYASVNMRSVARANDDSSAQALSELLASLTIHQTAVSTSVWRKLSTLLCFASCLLAPFQASFNSTSTALWIIV